MRILLDHGAPRGLLRVLPGHDVVTAYKKGWDRLTNGALLTAAEQDGFELIVTTDSSIRYQQNLKTRKIAIIVLTGDTKWSQVRQHIEKIVSAIALAGPGSFAEIAIPFAAKRGKP